MIRYINTIQLFAGLTLILLTGPLSADAQKLPNIQQSKLRAPSTVKIDGKATEWNNQFQAYNRATDVFYTLSNDDENLYLTIKAIDQDVINKIVGGGISFIIARAGKKNDKNNIAIISPF